MSINYIQLLKDGAIGVMPTDTIYGLLGLALDKKTVQRIYRVRKRNPKKPAIVLIKSLNDLRVFGIKLNSKTKKILSNIWPGKISVILLCRNKKYPYLHRGTNTLAIRFPKDKQLIKILKETGPLLAPSANIEGSPHSLSIKDAKKYFGNKVFPEPNRLIDFYIDKGILNGKPSTLISINNGRVIVLRQGSVRIKL